MIGLSYHNRQTSIDELKSHTFDLVVIGGGITGAGIAVQAAASGLHTALIEMQDFTEGTSSRSTKLVHGGIRYLKQFDVEVVGETVQERGVIHGIAPHVPKPDPMIMPLYDEPGASFSPFELEVAMKLYDDLAGITDGPYKNQLLTREEVIKRVSNISTENLIGGGVYLDYNNSDIKLVIENIKQSVDDGAIALSRAKVIGFDYTQDKVVGVEVEDLLTGETFIIKTHVAINATGPWSDTIRSLDEKDQKPPQMRPTKGVHLVIDRRKLPVDQPVYFDTGEEDGRMVFVIPRESKTYFGTTDTDFDGDFTNPTVTQADVDYLLRIINRRFPHADISINDIESSWAGLRPLISSNAASDYNGGDNGSISDKSFQELVSVFDDYRENNVTRARVEEVVKNVETSTSEKNNNPSAISRGSDLTESESGLLTIAGGKITDYRKMAEGAMKVIIERLEKETNKSFNLIDSKTYQISGGHFDANNIDEAIQSFTEEARNNGFEPEVAEYLANWYGSNISRVLSYLEDAKTYAEKYNYKLSIALGLIYSLAEEGTYTAVDFLLRRTNFMLFRHHEIESLAEPILHTIQDYLGLDEKEYQRQKEELQATIDEVSLKDLKEAVRT